MGEDGENDVPQQGLGNIPESVKNFLHGLNFGAFFSDEKMIWSEWFDSDHVQKWVI